MSWSIITHVLEKDISSFFLWCWLSGGMSSTSRDPVEPVESSARRAAATTIQRCGVNIYLSFVFEHRLHITIDRLIDALALRPIDCSFFFVSFHPTGKSISIFKLIYYVLID